MDTINSSLIAKRPVNKVRRQFLNRRQDEEESEIVDSAARYITNHDVWIIASSIYNSSKNQKSSAWVQFLNSHFSVNNVTIGRHSKSKVVTLNLKINQRNVNMPWEYMTKRLETYDDVKILMMAQEFSRFNAGYNKAMQTNFGLLSPDHPEGEKEIKRVRARAIRAIREIESQYTFNKIEMFVKDDFSTFLSASYSEGLLKNIGYTVDQFCTWAKMNGLPNLFDIENSGYQEIARKRFAGIFQCGNIDGEKIDLGPEFIVPCCDKEGGKKDVSVRFVSLLDLLPEGKFITAYTIVKSKKSNVEKDNGKETYDGDSDLDEIECVKKNIKKESSTGDCDKKIIS